MLTHNWELELELCLDVADESSGSGFFSGFLAQVFTWDCAQDCASELALKLFSLSPSFAASLPCSKKMRVAVVEFARLPSHFPLHSLAFYHPRMDCHQNLPALLPPTITSLPYSRKMRVAAVEFA